MASNVCWGVEIGAGAVKAIKLERAGDALTVADFAVIPHKRVLSTPDLDQKDATRIALGALVAQHSLAGASLAVSVPGHSAFARFAKLPPVEPKKVPDIVKFEAVQQIPFPIDEVEWDFQTFVSADSPEIEVGIFAITRERVMDRLAMWEDVGLTPDIMTLSPLAAYNALAYDMAFGDSTPGTVIVDVGTTSTDLIVAEPGRMWIRTFPIGGHQFTEALVNTFKLTYTKAEKLKREAEHSKHARHVFQAMRPVFSDLAQDIQRSIGFYQSSRRDARLTRLVGLGSTFQLPGLRKYLSQQLQMEVVRLEKFNRISVEGERAAEFDAAAVNLATAYGLALQGLGLQTASANLMPVTVLRDAMWSRKTKWFAAAAGLAILAGGASFIRPLTDNMAMAGVAKPAIVGQTVAQARKLQGEWSGIESAFKPDYRAANARLLLERRDVFAHAVNDLGLMMAAATDSTQPADDPLKQGFFLQRFTTTYEGPGGGADAREAEFGHAQMEAPVVEEGTNPEQQTIKVAVEVVTSHPTPEAHLVNTLQKWLFANAKRDGIPYTIEVAARSPLEPRFRVVEQRTIEDPTALASTGTGAGAGTQVATPGQPGKRRYRSTGDPVVDFMTPEEYRIHQQRTTTTGSRRQQGGHGNFDPHQVVEGGEGERASGGAMGQQELANPELEKVAPLPPVTPPGKPGDRVTTLELTYTLVLTPPAGDKTEEPK